MHLPPRRNGLWHRGGENRRPRRLKRILQASHKKAGLFVCVGGFPENIKKGTRIKIRTRPRIALFDGILGIEVGVPGNGAPGKGTQTCRHRKSLARRNRCACTTALSTSSRKSGNGMKRRSRGSGTSTDSPPRSRGSYTTKPPQTRKARRRGKSIPSAAKRLLLTNTIGRPIPPNKAVRRRGLGSCIVPGSRQYWRNEAKTRQNTGIKTRKVNKKC